MNEEQIKDIFEQELDEATKNYYNTEHIVRGGAFDGRYSTAEKAMLETVKKVKLDIRSQIIDTWYKNSKETNSGDTKSTCTARFNAFLGEFFDERMKGNCPNCGTPHYLCPIGLDGINCELCQSED